jgi:hypothetical protein
MKRRPTKLRLQLFHRRAIGAVLGALHKALRVG